MSSLAALLLLVLGAEVNANTHYPGASTVFQCTFEAQDEEIYGWPSGWTRRQGPGFPRYVRMRLNDDRPPPGGRCLRVELNGGAAMAYGPPVSVNPNVQYVLEGFLRTSGLRHDGAYLSLVFLDSSHNKLESVASARISDAIAWRKLCVGPVSPPVGAASVLVGLHVKPQGDVQDLHGTAAFGGLWLGQVPRILLTAQPAADTPSDQPRPARHRSDAKSPPTCSLSDAKFLLFSRGRPIEIACVVSGFPAPSYEIRLRLLDVDGRVVARRETQMTSALARTTWRIPGNAVGFYRVRAAVVPAAGSPSRAASGKPPGTGSLLGPDQASGSQGAAGREMCPSPCGVSETGTTSETELGFVVIEPQILPSGSEFGWSLGRNDAGIGLAPLGDLLCESGVRWVKFPFTIQSVAAEPAGSGAKPLTEAKPKAAAAVALDPLISFSDRLSAAGISLAGVLQPSQAVDGDATAACELLSAEAFSRDPKTWYPSIEPVLARLATAIRFWQIGDDRDSGWVGCRDLPQIVARTKAQLDQIGQDMEVGIAWDLAAPLPLAPSEGKANRIAMVGAAAPPDRTRQKAPWRFLSLPCDEAISGKAMSDGLDAAKSAGIARWVVLAPLPRQDHTTNQRIVHLVDRMLAAKMHAAEAIFISDPFDPQRGLVGRDGSPGELFLPWRTTALALGGASYVGDIELPQGNAVRCFCGGGKFVGVVPGGKPCTETVYLGRELCMQDLWGNSRACPPTPPRDSRADSMPQSPIPIGQLPLFLTGLDGSIAQWHLNTVFSPQQLPSVPGTVVPLKLEVRNTFFRPISGRLSIRGPENWRIEPRAAQFCLDAGAVWHQHLEAALPDDVLGGRQIVRLDFEIQADRLYRFTVYRPVEVNLGDLTLDGRAVLSDRGDMEVRQTITNRGKRAAAFRCNLLAPDRRRQTTEVLIQPSGTSEVTYRLPEGGELRGKAIWLRAEEIDGSRVMNFRIEAPAAADSATSPEPRPEPGRPPQHGSSSAP